MLKLKLQYFGPLMRRAISLEKTWERLKAEEVGGRRWDGSIASPTQWTWIWANSGVDWVDWGAWRTAVHGVTESQIWLSEQQQQLPLKQSTRLSTTFPFPDPSPHNVAVQYWFLGWNAPQYGSHLESTKWYLFPPLLQFLPRVLQQYHWRITLSSTFDGDYEVGLFSLIYLKWNM